MKKNEEEWGLGAVKIFSNIFASKMSVASFDAVATNIYL
jgi:hypothetical protein